MSRAAAVAWAAAVIVALATGPFPPWRVIGAVGIGVVLCARFDGDRLRIGLASVATAPLLLPALLHGIGPVWALLVVAGGLGAVAVDRWRLGVAAAALVLVSFVAVKQEIAATGLPAAVDVVPGILAIGWLGATLALSAPGERGFAPIVLVFGAVGAGFVVRLHRDVDGMPLARAAAVVADRQAFSLWPGLEARAEADPGDLAGALAVVAGAPQRPATGEALARRFGAALPVAFGWDPRGDIDPDVAIDLGWTLEGRGELGRAIDRLRRLPRTGALAFHLSALAHEAGDESLAANAWSHATVPPGIARAPGTLLFNASLGESAVAEQIVAVERPSSGLVVRARSKPGVHLTISLGAGRYGPFDVGEGVWRLPVALSPGAYRLIASADGVVDGLDVEIIGA